MVPYAILPQKKPKTNNKQPNKKKCKNLTMVPNAVYILLGIVKQFNTVCWMIASE